VIVLAITWRQVLLYNEIEHDAPVAHGVAGDGVTASTHRDEQVALPSEPDGLQHVVGTRTPGDERRTPVDGAVPDPARLVVALLARPQQGA